MQKLSYKFSSEKSAKIFKEHNVTSRMLIEETGLSRYTVLRWLNGTVEPRAAGVRIMSELTGVPMEEFFEEVIIDVPERSKKKKRKIEVDLPKAEYRNPFDTTKMFDSTKEMRRRKKALRV